MTMDERKRFSYMVAVGITPASYTDHNPDVGLQDDSIPMYLVWDDGSDVQPHTQFSTVMNPLGCWSDSHWIRTPVGCIMQGGVEQEPDRRPADEPDPLLLYFVRPAMSPQIQQLSSRFRFWCLVLLPVLYLPLVNRMQRRSSLNRTLVITILMRARIRS
jgi:hypothetical protein